MWGLSSSFEAEMKALLPRLDDDSQQSLGGSVSKHTRERKQQRGRPSKAKPSLNLAAEARRGGQRAESSGPESRRQMDRSDRADRLGVR